MYIIDSFTEQPDIEYLKTRIEEEMKSGVAINDLSELRSRFQVNCNSAREIMQTKYGIVNPNSYNQVSNYFLNELNKEIGEIYSSYTTITGLDATAMLKAATLLKDKFKYIKEITDTEVNLVFILDEDDDKEAIKSCLQDILNCEMFKCMYRAGKWKVDAEAMKPLALAGREDAIDLLNYRKNKKYLETVESLIEARCGDGRIHPKVSLGITNRINYSKPALMNIPKDLLWAVVAPRKPGNLLISIDIKNQEPWIMANMLGIDRLKAMLSNKGGLYERVFEDIFGRLPSEIERREFKSVWLGLTYGLSCKGAEEMCNHIDAKEVYNYFSSFPEYKKYKSKCTALANKGVRYSETYFGTEVFAGDCDKFKLKRVLMDIGIQGTGSDILSLLVKHFDSEVLDRGLEDKLMLYFSRHDETIVEADIDYVSEVGKEEVFRILKDIFEHRIDDWEPFQVEIKEVGNGEVEIDE